MSIINPINRQNHMLISDAEKAFNNIQHSFMKKKDTWQILYWKEPTKGHQQKKKKKITANILPNGEKMNAITLRSEWGNDLCS